MKEKSLLQNYIFNLIKTLNGILFPLVTFAYSSRVLGVDGVGRVNFAKSVIACFSMIAMLGMNYYGTREAAKLRDDREKLSQFCVEMLLINGCATLLSYLLLLVAAMSIPRLRGYGDVLLVSSAAIALQGMGMEWLYQAMEEYRYIALRSALFQVGALVAMLLFVRKEGDVVPYAAVALAASSGSYILNFINARRYIRIRRHMRVQLARHMKPLLWLFAMAVSIELYTVLDTTMVGFLKGDGAVGLYTAAIKVERLVNTVIASAGVVLIPRLSYYIGMGENQRMRELVGKGYNYIMLLSIPAAVGLFMLSDEIILLFSGSKFAPAGLTMRIMTPIVIFIPFSMMTNQQTFVPMGKEKLILISTCVGATTNLLLNSLLIPPLAQNGAALATVVAEMAVAAVCLFNVSRIMDMRTVLRCAWQYWLAAAAIPVVALLVRRAKLSAAIDVLLTVPLSAIAYFLILRLLGNRYAREAVDRICGKVMKGRKCARG